jgi:hypothetical protein
MYPKRKEDQYGYSNQLKLLRAAKGWTQAEMAEAMGVSPKTFWAMENGCKLTPYMPGEDREHSKDGDPELFVGPGFAAVRAGRVQASVVKKKNPWRGEHQGSEEVIRSAKT